MADLSERVASNLRVAPAAEGTRSARSAAATNSLEQMVVW
jgi:hypothetical protein